MTNMHTVDRYRDFARRQAAGVSPSLEAWALAVADDADMIELLTRLPFHKQQPNLVFAAARLHGAIPGDTGSLRDTMGGAWELLSATILKRSTQTNEAARCAALLLGLEQIDGPVALVEIGAAAGLCLLPDRYSYVFDNGGRLHPTDGPSPLTIPIGMRGGISHPTRMPDIVWRAGLDLNPLDPAQPDDVAWLEALVWPEHEERRARLAAAAAIAARAELDLRSGDLLTGLVELVDDAPAEAMLVVTHSATLAYLTEQQRLDAVDLVARTGARRIGFEGRGVDPSVAPVDLPVTPETLFTAALDGQPYALADSHGRHLGAIVPETTSRTGRLDGSAAMTPVVSRPPLCRR